MGQSGLRLVATDLDGTLLQADNSVSERTVAALRAAVEQGIEVLAVTGRSHRSTSSILGPLGLFRMAICSNGATVYDFERQAVAFHRPLERDRVDHVLEVITAAFPTVGLAWELPDGVRHTERWLANRAATDAGFLARFGDRANVVHQFDPDEGPILKLMLAHDHLTTYAWYDAVVPHLPPALSLATSGAPFVEITAADANKGAALASHCDDQGLQPDHVVAFGDHVNDLPMLEWVGASYAMGNAGPRIRDAADEVAPRFDEDGVAVVLEGLLAAGPPPSGVDHSFVDS